MPGRGRGIGTLDGAMSAMRTVFASRGRRRGNGIGPLSGAAAGRSSAPDSAPAAGCCCSARVAAAFGSPAGAALSLGVGAGAGGTVDTSGHFGAGGVEETSGHFTPAGAAAAILTVFIALGGGTLATVCGPDSLSNGPFGAAGESLALAAVVAASVSAGGGPEGFACSPWAGRSAAALVDMELCGDMELCDVLNDAVAASWWKVGTLAGQHRRARTR